VLTLVNGHELADLDLLDLLPGTADRGARRGRVALQGSLGHQLS
jgi:hypothetical protein